jgi:hypothetical protein
MSSSASSATMPQEELCRTLKEEPRQEIKTSSSTPRQTSSPTPSGCSPHQAAQAGKLGSEDPSKEEEERLEQASLNALYPWKEGALERRRLEEIDEAADSHIENTINAFCPQRLKKSYVASSAMMPKSSKILEAECTSQVPTTPSSRETDQEPLQNGGPRGDGGNSRTHGGQSTRREDHEAREDSS